MNTPVMPHLLPFKIQRLLFFGVLICYVGLFMGVNVLAGVCFPFQVFLLLVQIVHSLYLGYKKGSHWHRYFAWLLLFYLFAVAAFFVLFDDDNFIWAFFFLICGMIIPLSIAGWYAFKGHLYYKEIVLRPPSEVLDDDFLF